MAPTVTAGAVRVRRCVLAAVFNILSRVLVRRLRALTIRMFAHTEARNPHGRKNTGTHTDTRGVDVQDCVLFDAARRLCRRASQSPRRSGRRPW
jgi:hypothetical protein